MRKVSVFLVLFSVFFYGCNLDFSNESADEWIIYNNAKDEATGNPKSLTVGFNSESKNITEKVTIVKADANATITIDDAYHVNFETSYYYSSTPAKRKLTITNQVKYTYLITNNSSNTIYAEYDSEKKEIAESNSIEIITYKTKPSISIYYLDNNQKIFVTSYSIQESSNNDYIIVIS